MDKEQKLGTWALIILFVGFACYLDNDRMKKIEDLEFKLTETEDMVSLLKDENTVLKSRLCNIEKDNSKECQQARKDLEIMKFIEGIFSESLNP